MISQNPENQQQVTDLSSAAIISVNRAVRFIKDKVTKAQLKVLADSENRYKNWSNESVTIQELALILAEGYTIKTGISDKSIKESDMVEANWIVFDFDETTIQDTLSIAWSDHACLLYKTPGYVEGENEKHRLVFRLDRKVSIPEYKILYAVIRTFYPKTDNTASPAQCFFGAATPDSVTVLNANNTLPVEKILSLSEVLLTNEKLDEQGNTTDDVPDILAKSLRPKTRVAKKDKKDLIAEKEQENVTTQVLRFINKKIFIDECQGNVNKLFMLYQHDLYSIPCDRNEQLAKYQGKRPDSHAESKGFVVTVCNDNLPPTCYNRATGETWNILEYWYQCRNLQTQGKYWNSDKFNLKLITDDICKTFGIDNFVFTPLPTGLMGALRYYFSTDLEGQLCVQGWEGERDSTRYMYFDTRINVWKKLSVHNLVNIYLTPRFKKENENWYELIQEYMVENNKKKPPQIQDLIKNYLNNNVPKIIDFHPEIDPRLVVLKNGIFNLETGVMEENNGQAFNFNPSPEINFSPVQSNDPVIENLSTYFADWLRSDVEGELLLAYLVLCVKREAYKLKKIICMQGTSNKGKSTYGALVQNVMNGSSKSRSESRVAMKMSVGMLLGNNPHEIAAIENKYMIYLDEINTLDPRKHNIELLKELSSEERDRDITIKPIYEKPRNIKNYAAFIAVSEDNFRFPTSDGMDNRFTLITVNEDTNMELGERLKHLQANLETIHNWCLTEDSEYWLDRFRYLCKDEKMVQTLIEQKRATEPLVEFIEEHFEVTDDKKDTVDGDIIWMLFQNWKQDVYLSRNYSSKQTFGMHLTKVLKEAKYGFNWELRGGVTTKASGSTIKPKRTNLKLKNNDIVERILAQHRLNVNGK